MNIINNTSKKSSLNLFVKNTNYQPPPAGPFIEQYLQDAYHKLKHNMELNPVYHKANNYNSTLKQILSQLARNSKIVVKPADKNLGTVVVSRHWYEAEALSQLNDSSTYMHVTHLPYVKQFWHDIMTILTKFNTLYYSTPKPTEQRSIKRTKMSQYILQYFMNNDEELLFSDTDKITPGKFYMLVKIHKQRTCGRPIVASMNTPTYFASKYLDTMLQPLVKSLRSYIKDSTQLIIELENRNFPQNCTLLGADVESLYPSIDITDGLCMLRRALERTATSDIKSNRWQYTTTQIELFLELASWVLNNNYFEFGLNNYYKQIKGTAMGTPFAVSFACIYMGELEHEAFAIFYSSYKMSMCILYFRFIDDIISAFLDRLAAEHFMTIFNNLRKYNIKLLTTHSGISADFLDLTIYKGERFDTENKLDTKIFQKSFNKYVYVPPTSFHKQTSVNSTIISELKRYRTICYHDTDFYVAVNNFKLRLMQRGYTKEALTALFKHCDGMSRQQLLNKHTISRQYNKKEINFNNSKIDDKNNSGKSPFYDKNNDVRHDDETGSEMNLLIFKTEHTNRQHKLHLLNCLQPSEVVDYDPKSLVIFKDKSPIIISQKRAKNIKDLITTARYKYTITNMHTDTQQS